MINLHVYEVYNSQYLNHPDVVSIYAIKNEEGRDPIAVKINETNFRNDSVGKIEKRDYISKLESMGAISVEEYSIRYGLRL